MGDQAGLRAARQFGVCLHENPGRRPEDLALRALARLTVFRLTDNVVHTKKNYHHHHTQVLTRLTHWERPKRATMAVACDGADGGASSARRRRERLLRAFWRHETFAVWCAFATATHHSAYRPRYVAHADAFTQTATPAPDVYAATVDPPLLAEPAPPIREATPVVDAPPVVVELVPPAPVAEPAVPAPAVSCAAPPPVDKYVAPEPVVTYAAPVPVDDYVAPEPSVTYAAPTPVFEYVAPPSEMTHAAPAPVVKLATPAPAVSYAAPTPVAESMQVPQVQVVEKTIEIPQRQIIEKTVEFPEIQAILGTQTFESLGTAPFRQVAPAEIVEVVKLVPPFSAESALPMFVTAPVVEAAPGVVGHVQPAQVVEYVTPAAAVTCVAPAPVAEYAAPATAVTIAAPAFVDEYVAPAPVVAHVAPAPVVKLATPDIIDPNTGGFLCSTCSRGRAHACRHQEEAQGQSGAKKR